MNRGERHWREPQAETMPLKYLQLKETFSEVP